MNANQPSRSKHVIIITKHANFQDKPTFQAKTTLKQQLNREKLDAVGYLSTFDWAVFVMLF